MQSKLTSNPLDPTRYPEECEIVIPVTLKVPILLELEVSRMPPVCHPQVLETVKVLESNVTSTFTSTSTQADKEIYTSSVEVYTDDTLPDSRVFLYQVVGLHQNENTDKMNCPIRRSGSVWIAVPYSRMNQEMRRITRMGGKIVSIQPKRGNKFLAT